MITALEYITEREGVSYALAADKNMRTRNAWHLKGISGNSLPPISALGAETFGIAGRSYQGLAVKGREIEAELYADGYSPDGLQGMLSAVSRVITPESEALGVLRLRNAAGDWFRIAAKCVEFEETQRKRRSSLFGAVFDCPFPYFESDVLQVLPLFAVEGGKEYPIDEGLERPYTFGDVSSAGATEVLSEVYNAGDVAAPVVVKLFGAGLSRVEVTNQTTGAAIIVSGMSVGGIEICTDENDLYAVFDDGSDASRYVSMYSDISGFTLAPGANVLHVSMEASSVTVAGTQIEWRGRFATCL